MTGTFGIAVRDITPPIGVPLMGYDPRVSTGVDHALRSEALACAGDGGGWILLSADVCAFSAPLARRVRKEIGKRTGLATEAVMLTATHTHSGPQVSDAFWREQSILEADYFKTLRDRLVEVACAAWAARSPGELVYTRTMAPGLGSNRRVQNPDGTWCNQWSDPDGVHTGYVDPTVELVGVRRPNGRLDALLVNFGCHPVCLGRESSLISGDYVGHLKDALEGSGTRVGTVLFTVSGHANVDPQVCVQSNLDVPRRLGDRLAAVVERALVDLVPVGGEGIGAAEEAWAFETNWTIDGRLAMYFPHAAHQAPVQSQLSALAAGHLALLGLPGETVSEYRERFCQRSPFPQTLLISLANDFLGYLPTDAIIRQGAYEATLCPLQPLESVLTRKVDILLRRLGKESELTPERN